MNKSDVLKNKLIGKIVKNVQLINTNQKKNYNIVITANTSLYTYSGYAFENGEVILFTEIDLRPGYNTCDAKHMLVATSILDHEIIAGMHNKLHWADEVDSLSLSKVTN